METHRNQIDINKQAIVFIIIAVIIAIREYAKII